MPSELEELEARAQELADVAADRCEGARGARMAERLGTGRFLVSVVGEFKRGKSTLINGLVGAEVLPAGVLPLTAVATEVAYGEPGAVVELADGARRLISPAELADWVTEERNPANERGVTRVEVRGRWPLLEQGVVLVDTPGIASVYRHNTDAARAAVLDADGAVVVLSVDSPVSESEHDLLRLVAERQAPTFFVLNKADHLTPAELDQVRRFVGQVLAETLGRKAHVFVVSARAALAARLAGRGPGAEAGEFAGLVAELERFIAADLVAARVSTARVELGRLGRSLADTLAVEQAALDSDAVTLAGQVELFREAASHHLQAFDDDRTLLDRDVARLGDDLAARLADFARTAPARHLERLAAIAASSPRAQLTDDLQTAIESAVRESFEAFRQAEADRTEQAWEALAATFRDATQERVDAVRQAAAELFAVPLSCVRVPTVAEQRERFFYLFIHIGGFNEPFGRLAGRLVPSRVARRRASARARAELVGEFDKHAGRARWDLTQRLDTVRRGFETAMRVELDVCVEAIVEAARRAEELRGAAEADRVRHHERAARQAQLAAGLAELAQDTA
ncbi:MAG: dynamin family protein [Acidimicrobiales bacterium]